MSVRSFAASTAEKFGLTDRHVRRMIAAGSSLHPDQIRALRQAPKPITLQDLIEIAKISQPADRYVVVDRLAAGRAKSAADALRSLRAEAAGEAPVKDPAEEQFLTLSKAWARAGVKARKRFLLEYAREIWHDENAGVPLARWADAVERPQLGEDEAA